MPHSPKRPHWLKRKVGDLSDRQSFMNGSAMQKNNPSRYDNESIRRLTEEDTKKVLRKVQAGRTATGQPATPVEIKPEVNSSNSQIR